MSLFSDGVEGEAQTTNATVTEIARKTIPENCRIGASIRVAGRSTAGVGAYWEIVGSFSRGTGNAAMVGSLLNVVTPIKDVAALLWTASLDVDGQDIVVNVSGAAGTTVNWGCLGPIVGVEA